MTTKGRGFSRALFEFDALIIAANCQKTPAVIPAFAGMTI
jgi:hypothetical protein